MPDANDDAFEALVAKARAAGVAVDLPISDLDAGNIDWMKTKIAHHCGVDIVLTPELLKLYSPEQLLNALRALAPAAKGELLPMGKPCRKATALAAEIRMVAERMLGEIIVELDERRRQ